MEGKEPETVNQGAGFYDFDQILGNKPAEEEVEDTEPKFDVINEEPEEEVETTEVEEEEEPSKEEKEEEKEEPAEEIKEEEKKATQSSNYSNLAKKYIEMGSWDDAKLEIDGEEVILSELEDLDEETFLQIQQAQENTRKEELQEKYINKEDLDEISLKIVEISKNGGDISDVLRIKEEFINPLETYDLTDEAHQEHLVRQMYSMENRALTKKQIDRLIAIDKEEMELDSKAQDFADKLKASYHQTLEQKKQQAIDAQENEKKSLRDLKKSLKQELAEMGMKETAMKPLLDAATQKEKDGFGVDKQFQELKKDPKRFAEFLLWYSNPEEYKKKVSSTASIKKDADALKIMSLAPKTGNKKEVPKQKEKTNNLEQDFMSRIKIKQ